MDDGSSIQVHLLAGFFLRMWLAKYLLSNLPKLADGDLRDIHQIFVLVDLEEIMLIALVVIKVVMLLRILIGCFVAENQIDPVV